MRNGINRLSKTPDAIAMIKFRGKIEELNGEVFVRIPDKIIIEYDLKIGNDTLVMIQKVK